ncbi:polymorphic toxin type 15 domain-containing protein [Streptococcus gordonii]|uniref:polymorphic toxin type 15 domain-containing protein n=1 Tax=Streptococcus gordonii TaxID=1302 RepID=UPI000AB5BBF0|nr:polymorphic toxin type 15 domain-containing protein [Streptococcus gordonii]
MAKIGVSQRAASEFQQEVSEQLAKHSDDVAKGLEETAETGKRVADNFADDIGEEIPRLDEVSVEFKYKDKFDKKEFSRQLKGQQDGLNDLTVQEYFDNRERYLKEGRSKEGSKAQKAARKKALEDKTRELILSGDTPDVAEKKAKEWMKEQAALHDPDQIAGGDPTKIRGVGDSRINSSLGVQWKKRIDAMDEQIRKLAAGLSPEELKTTYLNINLSY